MSRIRCAKCFDMTSNPIDVVADRVKWTIESRCPKCARCWYVIACAPLLENQVKRNITRKVQQKGLKQLFGKMVAPKEKTPATSNSKFSVFDVEGEEIGVVWANDCAEALWKAKRRWDGEYREVRETVEVSKGVTQTRIKERIRIEVKEVILVEQGGKSKLESEKVFPGYVFVEMVYNDDTFHTSQVPGAIGLLPLRPKLNKKDPSEQEVEDYERWRPIGLNSLEEAQLFARIEQQKGAACKVKMGETVSVMNGTYKGTKGNVVKINGDVNDPTIHIEVPLMGRNVTIQAKSFQLTKV